MSVLCRTVLENKCILELVQGDLTEQKVDAIVNAANRWMNHGGGVAGAIVRKGGVSIQQESEEWVRRNGPIDHDRPAWTSAGTLPCRFVLHVVGPVWGEGDEDGKLIRAVRSALVAARDLSIESLAMPPISTGIFRFPKIRAAPLFYSTIVENGPVSRLRLIRIVIIDDETGAIFLTAFKEYFRCDG